MSWDYEFINRFEITIKKKKLWIRLFGYSKIIETSVETSYGQGVLTIEKSKALGEEIEDPWQKEAYKNCDQNEPLLSPKDLVMVADFKKCHESFGIRPSEMTNRWITNTNREEMLAHYS